MPPVNTARAHRLPRAKSNRQRPPVHRDRLVWLNARPTKDRRVRRLSAARIGARPRVRVQAIGPQLPLAIELVRAAVLVALAVFAITVVLPALLALATASF